MGEKKRILCKNNIKRRETAETKTGVRVFYIFVLFRYKWCCWDSYIQFWSNLSPKKSQKHQKD